MRTRTLELRMSTGRPAPLALGLTCGVLSTLFLSTALAATLERIEIAPEHGVWNFDRETARALVERDLLHTPSQAVVVGSVDLYERFPYVETRAVEIVADPGWDRLVAGMTDTGFIAWDGTASPWGLLRDPHGLAADEWDRVYVADTGNDRIVVLQLVTSAEGVAFEPRWVIPDVVRPFALAYSDGGTPWQHGDDRLYVTESGQNRVTRFDLDESGATRGPSIGSLGSGTGRFAGPQAIAVGSSSGAATDVYVLDAHNRRTVRLVDGVHGWDWSGASAWSEFDGRARGLTVDRWGNVYTATEAGSVYKWNSALGSVGAFEVGTGIVSDVHVPALTVRDHRDGSVRRKLEDRAVSLDDWSEASGISLWRLSADIIDLEARSERSSGTSASPSSISVDFVLSDRARVLVEAIRTIDGEVVARTDLGVRDAGRLSVPLVVPAPRDLDVRVTATSAYENGETVRRSTRLGDSQVTGLGATSLRVSPNPFRDVVRFVLPGSRAGAVLDLYDPSGRHVRALTIELGPDGPAATWDGLDAGGHRAPQGLYLCRLHGGGPTILGKVLHLR